MRKTELQMYKRRLLDLRSRLTGDVDSVLDGLASDRSREARSTGDEADLGNDLWDAELALSLSRNGAETLSMINAALKRIEDGTYGTCIETGQKIAKDRLDAIPYTPYCVEAAAQMEKKRNASQSY